MSTEEFMRERYALEQRPFKDRIAKEKWLDTWTNREEEIEKWTAIIADSVSTDKNYLALIIGDYGQGKTLSLMKIIEMADKYEEILPIRLNFKGEERSKPGLDFIFRVFKNIDFARLIEDRHDDLESAIENISDGEVRAILGKICFGEGKTSRLALYFLRGEITPTQSQLKELEVLRKIDKIDIAKEYLTGLLTFIAGLGYRTLLLAIDEFEYLFSLVPRTQHSIYLALLRALYDLDGDAKMSFFIAISESGWSYLDVLDRREESGGSPSVPLRRRVDDMRTLGPFSKKQTKKLIEKRLSYNRIKGISMEKPLIPFTEDFVDFIWNETKGALAKIILRCDHVLDAGIAERVPILDREFAIRVLEERGF